MSESLETASCVQARELVVPVQTLPTELVVTGTPRAGSVTLGRFGEIEVGVWEHSAGASTDSEVDEVFIVIDGCATIEFITPPAPTMTVSVGDIVRLAAGMQTRWTINERLRKVYLIAADEHRAE